MIDIIHGYERLVRPKLFDAMFLHRKHFTVDLGSMGLNPVDDELDIDSLDRDDAVYLCSRLPDGALTGSVRFLNTMTATMAEGLSKTGFSNLVVRAPTIWECSRFVFSNNVSRQPNGAPLPACELIVGMCLFGLENGVTQMTAVHEASLEAVFTKCGLVFDVVGRCWIENHGAMHYSILDISRDLEISVRRATQLPLDLLGSRSPHSLGE